MSKLLLAGPAAALTINLHYDEDHKPSFDPNGQRLMTIARAAADIWEWHILDDTSIDMDISWDNLDDEGRMAKYVPSYVPYLDSIDIVVSTEMDGAVIPWFFDETPLVDEEFAPFTQMLVRDLGPEHADAAYSGGPPLQLEAGFFAFATPGSPAQGNFDLLSFLLHEFGHALGMNYSFNDSDYDFDPADIGGLHVGANEGDGYELVLRTALMNDNIAFRGQRTMPSATDILATHDQNGYTHYNLRRIDLLGQHSNDWNDSLNWIGGKVPEWFNDVFLRNGGSVRLGGGLAQTRTLLVDEGSSLLTAGSSQFQVIHELRVGNAANGTSGQVHIGALSGVPQLEAGSFNIDDGLINLNSAAATMISHGRLQIGSHGTLMGAGTVETQGELNNDGEISAGMFTLFGFSGDLYLRAIDGGKLDLDGGAEPVLDPGASALAFPLPLGNEFGRISAVNGNLRVISPLADAFNGTATIGAGRIMQFYQPWSFAGELTMRGGQFGASPATLTGAEINFGGTTTVEGTAVIEASLTTGLFTRINVAPAGRLQLLSSKLGPTSRPNELAGKITLGEGAWLYVNPLGGAWTLKNSLAMAPTSMVYGDDVVNNGRIEGAGLLAVLRVDNNGVMAPTGELNVDDLFVQSGLGRLEVDLAGFGQGSSYDVLRVGGTAVLDGQLGITLAEGFLPAAGTQFDVLAAAQVDDAFASFVIRAPADVEFGGELLYSTNRVTFRVTHAKYAADFDNDGDVDAADLTGWKSSGGVAGDGGFLLAWQRQLGRQVDVPGGRLNPLNRSPFPLVLGQVPEPSSCLLAAAAIVVGSASRWRRLPGRDARLGAGASCSATTSHWR